MDWLNRIKSAFSGRAAGAPVLWLYVQCNRCKTPVAVRINLYNDPSLDEAGGYVLRKEIMDSKCFQLMRAELHLDQQRRIKEQAVEGGKFLSKDEYEKLSGGALAQ
ncbi:MAG: hypothetical protein WCF84_05365 [Anaerolineae bacterium]